MKVDVGRMTQDECADLLPEIIDALPEDVLLRILSDKLTPAQIDELTEALP
jgi:hypothetical protein